MNEMKNSSSVSQSRFSQGIIFGYILFCIISFYVLYCIDMIHMYRKSGIPPSGFAFILYSLLLLAFTGILVGFFECLVVFVAHRIKGESLSSRIVPAMYTLFLEILIVPVSFVLFSGHGISQYSFARYAPYITILLLSTLTFFTFFIAQNFQRCYLSRGKSRHFGVIAAAILFLTCLVIYFVYLDYNFYVGQYLYLHNLLFLFVFMLVEAILYILYKVCPEKLLIRWWSLAQGKIIIFLILAGQYFVFTNFLSYPSICDDKAYLFRKTSYLSRIVSVFYLLTDFDFDGNSAYLGGGDCNGFDSNIYLGARDIPNNGIDEDCIGGDLDQEILTTNLRVWKKKPYQRLKEKYYKDFIKKTQNKNIIILSVDALRADRFSEEYLQNNRFPNLMRLYSESVHFEKAYSVCSSTRGSVLSMLYGIYNYKSFSELAPLEILIQDGWNTISVNTGGFFEKYLKIYADKFFTHKYSSGSSKDVIFKGASVSHKLTNKIIEVIQRHRGEKFLLWSHNPDPHGWEYYDYVTGRIGDSYDRRVNSANRYDMSLSSVDKGIGMLLKFLKKEGLLDELIIIVTADHGEALGEKGYILHCNYIDNVLTHIPLFIRIPGIGPQELNIPVSLVDLFPTILAMANIPCSIPYDGENLIPLILGKTQKKPVCMQAFYEKAVIENNWKLTISKYGNTHRLYDLDIDPLENNSLVYDRQEKFNHMYNLFITSPFFSESKQTRSRLRGMEY